MESSPALEALDFFQLRNVTLNDPALMREVIIALVSDASRQIEELRGAVAASDAQRCARLAHSLVGACGNVGAVSLAALFQIVERQATRKEFSRCQASIERMDAELEKLRLAAAAILEAGQLFSAAP